MANHGASVIFILLNEGWYKNHTAASQFMYYSALRAIETRKHIVRSSNDGITCMINNKGEIEKSISEYKKDVLKVKIPINKRKTFYMMFGDFIGMIASILFGMIFVYIVIVRILKRAYR